MLTSNPRYVLRALFGITFSLLLLCVSAQSAWACDPLEVTNYWYRLNYEIPSDLLPPDIEVSVSYPQYGVHLDAFGSVEFTNNSAHELYILPGDAIYRVDQYREDTSDYAQFVVALSDALAQNDPNIDLSIFSQLSFTPRVIEPETSGHPNSDKVVAGDLRETFDLPQTPGGVTSPVPEPSQYKIVLLHDNQFYQIPLTITYTLNPEYDETQVASGAALSDYLLLSDNVVLGTITGAAPGSELVDHSSNDVYIGTYVSGVAEVSVEEQVYGEGPDTIYVRSFTTDFYMCGPTIKVGTELYFVLTETDNPVSNNDGVPTFGYNKLLSTNTTDSREWLASAIVQTKNVLVDKVMSIHLPVIMAE